MDCPADYCIYSGIICERPLEGLLEGHGRPRQIWRDAALLLCCSIGLGSPSGWTDILQQPCKGLCASFVFQLCTIPPYLSRLSMAFKQTFQRPLTHDTAVNAIVSRALHFIQSRTSATMTRAKTSTSMLGPSRGPQLPAQCGLGHTLQDYSCTATMQNLHLRCKSAQGLCLLAY